MKSHCAAPKWLRPIAWSVPISHSPLFDVWPRSSYQTGNWSSLSHIPLHCAPYHKGGGSASTVGASWACPVFAVGILWWMHAYKMVGVDSAPSCSLALVSCFILAYSIVIRFFLAPCDINAYHSVVLSDSSGTLVHCLFGKSYLAAWCSVLYGYSKVLVFYQLPSGTQLGAK